ncbi:unnamed protein product, partial [Meganyctiphanes norvegica]
MEVLPDGAGLEGESHIISLIGNNDLSLVDTSMLQNDHNVMMGFVGDDDEALSAAFSDSFPPSTSTPSVTSPCSRSISSPPNSSYLTTHLSSLQIDREIDRAVRDTNQHLPLSSHFQPQHHTLHHPHHSPHQLHAPPPPLPHQHHQHLHQQHRSQAPPQTPPHHPHTISPQYYHHDPV